MIEPSLPSNETARVESLRKTGLLESPLEERFERITRLACRLLGVPIAAISLIDSSRQWFKSVQGLDMTETPRRIAFCAHAILNDEPMVVPDARQDDRFHDNPLVTGSSNVVFYAGQPLKSADGHNVGVLCAIDNKPRYFSPDDLQTLRDLAALVETELSAMALSETQRDLVEQMDEERRRAMVDPLTRLWNREGILEILAREYDRALGTGGDIAVLIADLDYFKHINDTHGHPVGDIVLREAGKRILGTLRSFDAVGRFGGEEFLIVAPARDENLQVAAIALRVCNRIGESPIRTPAGPLTVTISVGGTRETIRADMTFEDLIKSADDALYRAKRAGRNRVEVAA